MNKYKDFFDEKKFIKEIDGYLIYETTVACPQQFIIIKNNEEVAYFRIRHGVFSIWVYCKQKHKDSNMEKIYESQVLGDGLFDEEEQDFELALGIEKIKKFRKKNSM